MLNCLTWFGHVVFSLKLSETDLMEKRIFGIILTILGIVGLIMAAVGFVNSENNWRELIVYGVLGFIFFFSGISLIRTTSDTDRIERID